MIKALCLIAATLTLIACSSTPDLRPVPVINYEDTMRQGIQAYQRDDYVEAIVLFNKALAICQSIDDHNGILFVKINLIESALAINNLDLAQQNLDSIKNFKQIDPNINNQIILLQAQQFFLQKQYINALKTINPLLYLLPEKASQYNPEQVNLLLTQTKFAIFANSSSTKKWFNKLKVIITNSTISIYQKALFKRLSAHVERQNKNYEKALGLLQQAIDRYKSTYNRRAIATCLEEKAAIYLLLNNKSAAHNNLIRAKSIREWLQDSHKTQSINKQLQLLKNITK